MSIDFLVVGKTDSAQVAELTRMYAGRISRYIKFTHTELPDIRNSKNMSEDAQKRAEGEMILRQLSNDDYVVLLDDKGAQPTSLEFASWMQKRMNSGVKRVVFIVGGPYGFSKEVYARAAEKLSLSRMTFSHQIIRPIFTEQLYRAFTILRGEPYHHE
ncbi:MAG: 23S rRNA (pseudouridine(1915)-N(3))-methyltransferase RlmH [Rikenellaceae bacterium]|jgi:23S rRNA (pseudouridine1915-N3)-methyltransferase|nr:23S rRNA (pseudouridine(1915)-N(3))-methyltransferase RlmH [Rikenellaceae bacterium]